MPPLDVLTQALQPLGGLDFSLPSGSEKLYLYKLSNYAVFTRIVGAANQTNLEPASLHSILDELEEWEAFLKAEPELIHKLRSFDEAAKPSQKPPCPARPRGPSL